MNTRDMEHAIYSELWKQGRYMCFEVTMPKSPNDHGFNNNERVDLLSYELYGKIWRFFELKLTVSDFHSKNKITFLGHYNYYVIPKSIYEKISNEIPDWVGVYTIHENTRGRMYASCEKKAKKQQLKVDHNDLLFSLMQSLSRENQKYRKLLQSKDHGKLTIDGKSYSESCLTSVQKFDEAKRLYEGFDFCSNCTNLFLDCFNSECCITCSHNPNLKDNYLL